MNSRLTGQRTSWERFLEEYWVLYLIVLVLAILFAISLLFCHACNPCDNSTLLQRIHDLETVNDHVVNDPVTDDAYDPVIVDDAQDYDMPTEEEVDDRRDDAGGEVGEVTATLYWNTTDDLDIMAKQPNNKVLSPAKRSDLSTLGEYDVDVNYIDENNVGVLTTNAVENIFWQNPGIGKYQLVVSLFKRRTAGSTPINFTLHWKVEGQGLIKQQGKLNKTGNALEFYFEYQP
jgi:hypothetical protein